MKKRILPAFLLLVLAVSLLLPVSALAAQPLDPNAQASLTLQYQKGDAVFPELPVAIYRVAQANPDGSFALIEPFSSWPVNIHGITAQEQWQTAAQTLGAYIVAEQVAPDRQALTGADGAATFSALETGLYFVCEAVADGADGTYVFNQFLVYLPTPQPDGDFTYDVTAVPKCTAFTAKTAYTVTKLWQDAGSNRPAAVKVDIYKDGVLQETQTLHADNDWTYTWYVPQTDRSRWTVAERDVADGYTVTVQQNGSYFTLINAVQQPDVDGGLTPQPDTGDSFTPLPWVFLLCLSGVLLLLLGVYGRRREA